MKSNFRLRGRELINVNIKTILINLTAATVAATITLVVLFRFYQEPLAAGLPINYTGDSLAVLAHIKAASEGDFPLGLPKVVGRLNAPYSASWSDFPITDIVYWIPGQFVTGENLFTVANYAVFGALAIAAVTFTLSAIGLGSQPVIAASLGVLCGLAPYGFVRQLEHLSLTWFFTVPISIYIVMKAWQDDSQNWKKYLLLCSLGCLCGLFNPYYVAMLLFLLGFVILGTIFSKDWRTTLLSFSIILSVVIGFLIQNLDTIIFRITNDSNQAAVSRDLWWMVKFGLYLPDMILPKFHIWDEFRHLAGRNYHYKIPNYLEGESQTAYIGIVSVVSLAFLAVAGIGKLFSRNQTNRNNPYFILALTTFLFAVTGGINYLFGSWGFQLLRGANRYSIFLMIIGLLATAVFLSQRIKNRIFIVTSGFFILLLGIIDQVPEIPDWLAQERKEGWNMYLEDRQVFEEIEKRLPSGSLVFQLPVHPFPESGPINKMGDYEHFRPYLHTNNLHWSYGTTKGRTNNEWQKQVDFIQDPDKSILQLKAKGFRAILINRRAYDDMGAFLMDKLSTLGCTLIKESSSYFICLLPPSS